MNRVIKFCLAMLALTSIASAQQGTFPPFSCLSVDKPCRITLIRLDGSRYATVGGGSGWYPEGEEISSEAEGRFQDREEEPPKFIYTRSNGEIFGTLNGAEWFRIGEQTGGGRMQMAEGTESHMTPQPEIAGETVLELMVSPGQFIFAYDLAGENHVRVSLLSEKGDEVEVITDEYQRAGRHTGYLNADALMSGTYFICVTVEGKRFVRPLPISK